MSVAVWFGLACVRSKPDATLSGKSVGRRLNDALLILSGPDDDMFVILATAYYGKPNEAHCPGSGCVDGVEFCCGDSTARSDCYGRRRCYAPWHLPDWWESRP
jgi:hypothetical protein